MTTYIYGAITSVSHAYSSTFDTSYNIYLNNNGILSGSESIDENRHYGIKNEETGQMEYYDLPIIGEDYIECREYNDIDETKCEWPIPYYNFNPQSGYFKFDNTINPNISPNGNSYGQYSISIWYDQNDNLLPNDERYYEIQNIKQSHYIELSAMYTTLKLISSNLDVQAGSTIDNIEIITPNVSNFISISNDFKSISINSEIPVNEVVFKFISGNQSIEKSVAIIN